MKYCLLFCLSLFALPAAAQPGTGQPGTANVEATAVFPGANVLLIHTSDSATTALKTFGRLLVRSGYTVDKSDVALGYLTTAEPVRPQLGFSYVYRAVVEPTPNGSTLIVTGRYTNVTGFAAVISGPVAAGKGRVGKGFAAIEQIGLAYPSGRIGYALNATAEKRTTLMGK